MNALRHILFILTAIFTLGVTSCINDDITDSPTATLTFSSDTINFGTIFTDLTTPTARLIVRNKNSKGVNISSIGFKNPETPFRLNVDGMSGSYFNDIEIRGHDSIYVFIECYVGSDEAVDPTRIADQLEFVTNGVHQEVEVEAMAWNVTRLNSYKVTEDITLTSKRPYVIFGIMEVEEGVTLTVEPGAWLLFHDKASIEVNGTLIATGNSTDFIRMSGDRLDDILPDVAYDQLAGQWEGITISPSSFGNRMEYVDMRSTVSGLRVDSCGDLSKNKLTILNSWLHNSQGSVLTSKYAAVDAYGCCFSEAAGSVVNLTGGVHNFVQCTIANSYLFSAYYQPNLNLNHCLPAEAEENSMPLMVASFENSIIWGEIGDPLYPGDLTGSQVFMRNVLFKAEGTDDANFVDCIWNENPLYYTVRSEYFFDYALKPDSPALGKGNAAYLTPECTYDMNGIYRLANGAPALGAYAE